MVAVEHKVRLSKRPIKDQSPDEGLVYPKSKKAEGKYVLPWETEVAKKEGFTENLKFPLRFWRTSIPNSLSLDDEPLVQKVEPDPEKLENSPETGLRVTWLGHASVLFQFDGVNMLINPNFSWHVGLMNFAKRYRAPVYSVEQIPRIDCVFITNTHLDFLDVKTIQQLNERYGDALLWYAPLGLGSWLSKQGCGSVIELDWWQNDQVEFIDYSKTSDSGSDDGEATEATFNIACTPSQSGHTRDLGDSSSAVLWCSWVIAGPKYRVYVSGSTGYHDQLFKTIGRHYGPFHVAALPIGRYNPDWKFGWGNVTPEQSVQIQQDVLAMCALGVSWGTVNISNEYYLEPAQRLAAELEKRGMSEMQFFTLKHGESRLFDVEKLKMEKGSDIKRLPKKKQSKKKICKYITTVVDQHGNVISVTTQTVTTCIAPGGKVLSTTTDIETVDGAGNVIENKDGGGEDDGAKSETGNGGDEGEGEGGKMGLIQRIKSIKDKVKR